MRILIDIGHPAHVHIFKNIVFIMQARKHEFLFTVREGEQETRLLDSLGFKYIKIGDKQRGIFKKALGTSSFVWKIYKIAKKFKPDVFLSHGSMYAGLVSFFLGRPHIALEDSGNMEQLRFSLPLSNVIISPDVLPADLGNKQIRYCGYHELMYLSPKYFSPNASVFPLLDIDKDKPYALIRFVSWEASHDKGKNGLNPNEKRELVQFLLSRGLKVFISAERYLLPDLEDYRLDIPFEMMHDALAFATIYVGEGATLASEAGILGVPSFYVSAIRRCYNDDQGKWGTVFNFHSFNGLLTKIDEVLSNPGIKENQALKAKELIGSKIDVTAFMVWFIENWPESFKVMKRDPSFQYSFRQ